MIMKKIKSFSTLIIVLLAIMAFVKGGFSQILMICTISLWIGIVFGSFLLQQIAKFVHVIEISIEMIKKKLQRNSQKSSFYDIDFSKEKIEELLLLHINIRITEMLQAIYPKVTWDWKTVNPLMVIISCGTAQICIKQTSEFNIAEVDFAPKGSIKFHFYKEVSLTEQQNDKAASITLVD